MQDGSLAATMRGLPAAVGAVAPARVCPGERGVADGAGTSRGRELHRRYVTRLARCSSPRASPPGFCDPRRRGSPPRPAVSATSSGAHERAVAPEVARPRGGERQRRAQGRPLPHGGTGPRRSRHDERRAAEVAGGALRLRQPAGCVRGSTRARASVEALDAHALAARTMGPPRLSPRSPGQTAAAAMSTKARTLSSTPRLTSSPQSARKEPDVLSIRVPTEDSSSRFHAPPSIVCVVMKARNCSRVEPALAVLHGDGLTCLRVRDSTEDLRLVAEADDRRPDADRHDGVGCRGRDGADGCSDDERGEQGCGKRSTPAPLRAAEGAPKLVTDSARHSLVGARELRGEVLQPALEVIRHGVPPVPLVGRRGLGSASTPPSRRARRGGRRSRRRRGRASSGERSRRDATAEPTARPPRARLTRMPRTSSSGRRRSSNQSSGRSLLRRRRSSSMPALSRMRFSHGRNGRSTSKRGKAETARTNASWAKSLLAPDCRSGHKPTARQAASSGETARRAPHPSRDVRQRSTPHPSPCLLFRMNGLNLSRTSPRSRCGSAATALPPAASRRRKPSRGGQIRTADL